MGWQQKQNSSNRYKKQFCPFNKFCIFLGGNSPESILADRDYLSGRVDELEFAMDFSNRQVIKLQHFCGLSVVAGSIVGFDNKCFQKGEPLYKALKATLPENSDAEAFLNALKQLIKDAIFFHAQHSILSEEEWRSGKKEILQRLENYTTTNRLNTMKRTTFANAS